MRSLASASSLVLAGVLLCAAGAARAQRTGAASAEGDESSLLVAEARGAIAARAFDRAAAVLDRALVANPRRLDAYLLRASVHAVQGEYEQGVTVLRKARALAPESAEVKAALGSQLVHAGRAEEGLALLERVVQGERAPYEAQATLGRYYAAHGRPKEAAAALAAYLASRPPELAGQDAAFARALADAELRIGAAAAARQRFAALVAADPKDDLARLGLAWATAAKDCAEALPLLDGLLASAGRYPDVLLVAGRCRLKVGQPAEARDLADHYLKLRPGAAGHALRGEALLAGGNAAEAIKELLQAVALEPDEPLHAIRLARVERQAGDPRAALAHLRAARGGERLEPDFSLELGEALLAAGEAPAAAALLGPLALRFPGSAPVRVARGAALLTVGDTVAALADLEAALELAPSLPRGRALAASALVGTAVADARAGRLGPAEAQLVRAVALEPTDVPALVNLGIVRLARGDAEAALAPLAQATRAGHDATALTVYGRALALSGKTAEAVVALQQAAPLIEGDPARSTELIIELAAAELDGGDPLGAATLLELALTHKAVFAGRQRLEDAFLVAARAGAARALAQGTSDKAIRLLDRAERLAGGQPDLVRDLRCELALAATAAGEREVALARLKLLEGARCPFPAPADLLAVRVLVAANAQGAQVEPELARLLALGRTATGPAEPLVAEVTRVLAVRAAAEAYAAGHGDRARGHLALALRSRAALTPELAYDQAVLDLDAGHVDEAIAALERLQAEVPEALVALGVAWDRKGEPARALEAYGRAQSQGVKVERLAEWIQAKRRFYGEEAQ